MRALPAPMLASVERTSTGATATIVTRGGGVTRGVDTYYYQRYQDWQWWARRYSRSVHAAHFANSLKADVCSRCTLRIEERDDSGDWNPTEDPALAGLPDEYANPLQSTSELVRLHAWHYTVTGEGVMTIRDNPDTGGVQYGVFSMAVVEWDQPQQGMARVRLTPDGQEAKGTAIVLPRDQLTRFWLPDEEFQAYATSNMASAVADLKRHVTLNRYALSTVESQIAMSGGMWVPGEAIEKSRERSEELDSGDIDDPQSPFERAYYETARLRFDENYDDIAAVAPLLVHWDHEYGQPQPFQIGRGLDQQGIAYRQEALQDYARGADLPASLIMGGGPDSSANHWTAWLVDEHFFETGIAPTMNRITH